VRIAGLGADVSRQIGSEPAVDPSSEQSAGRRLVEIPGPVAWLGSGLGLRVVEPGTSPSEERIAVYRHAAVHGVVEDTADCFQWHGGSAGTVLR